MSSSRSSKSARAHTTRQSRWTSSTRFHSVPWASPTRKHSESATGSVGNGASIRRRPVYRSPIEEGIHGTEEPFHERRGDRRREGLLMMSKAAVLHGLHQPWTIEEIEIGEPRAGEVLVEWKSAGMCHSDDHLVTGDMVPPAEV